MKVRDHIDRLKAAVKATDDAANAVIDAHIAARDALEALEAATQAKAATNGQGRTLNDAPWREVVQAILGQSGRRPALITKALARGGEPCARTRNGRAANGGRPAAL
jgi:hypothetical protein